MWIKGSKVEHITDQNNVEENDSNYNTNNDSYFLQSPTRKQKNPQKTASCEEKKYYKNVFRQINMRPN